MTAKVQAPTSTESLLVERERAAAIFSARIEAERASRHIAPVRRFAPVVTVANEVIL